MSYIAADLSQLVKMVQLLKPNQSRCTISQSSTRRRTFHWESTKTWYVMQRLTKEAMGNTAGERRTSMYLHVA